jgi:RNA polymerase sigma factor (TIGR02999 family)
MPPSSDITDLLVAWSDGDEVALESLMPLVEREIRKIAHDKMRRENPWHTLQTTALVNEAYMRLINQKQTRWQNRAHFFAIAAQIMRRILLNYARDRKRKKRGGQAVQVSLGEATAVAEEKSAEIIALDEALKRLAAFDERKSRVVELRYFGGLNVEETAEVLKVSPITVMRDWKLAKTWLARELKHGA